MERKKQERLCVERLVFHPLATFKKGRGKKVWGGTHAQNLLMKNNMEASRIIKNNVEVSRILWNNKEATKHSTI